MTELVILVPVLRRPHRVAPLLDSIRKATPAARVLFIPDPDDAPQRQAIENAGAEQLPLRGNYAHKINAGVRATSEPLIFTGADDLHFHPDWLKAAKAQMHDGIGVVGTRDLCNLRTETEHSTHSLVARWYAELGTIDEPGKLLHEGYPHEFVDDELLATARYRGAYAHAHDAVVEHLHPGAGKAPWDALYAAQRQRMRAGRPLFDRRKRLWQQSAADFTVAVATFGDNTWVDLARERAIPSADAQGVAVVHAHSATLAQARNAALAQVETAFVIHLDADDELAPGYVKAMLGGSADVRVPRVTYVRGGRYASQARVPQVPGHRHACVGECLRDGNFIVIGAAARTELVRRVGGWQEEPLYEDWSLWLRCWHAGATIETISAAVYRAFVRRASRNRAPDMALKNRVHREIVESVFGVEETAA